MHGNVWEWCQDWYGAYTRDDQTDPAGASGGSYRGSRSGNWSGNAAEDAIDPYVTGLAENRVYRGGSWYNDAANCRSAKRYGTLATNRIVNLGFRLARSVAGTEEPAPDGEARLPGDAPAAGFVESGRASLARKARVLNSPRPAYTERARREGTQGIVVVKVVLGANGRVLSASLVKGLPNGLNEKAVEAAYRLRFEPATDENGRPIDSTITVSVNFTIGDRK
jgi:TonB family protein